MGHEKILLISPPFYRLMGSHHDGIHLGLCYIASVLDKAGYEVKIYNADFFDSDRFLDQKGLFENYENYKSILNHLDHPIWQEAKENIKQFNPGIVGIQMYTGAYKSSKNIATISKEINPEIVIVAGGTHPTIEPEGTLKDGPYDYLIRGEGEYSFLDLIKGKRKEKILGLSFKAKNGEIIHNPDRGFIEDIDTIPFPSRDLFLNGSEKIDRSAIITSRGCPFQCTYCVSPKIWRLKVRYRSIENVLKELEYIYRKYNLHLIRFQDDTFTLNKNRVKAICTGILERGLKFEWVCDTRVDRLDREILALMKKAGCIRVKIGVESGSDEILSKVNKGFNKSQIKKAVSAIKAVGIPLTVYLMVGFHSETNKQVKETINFAKEIGADYYSLSIVSPYYGTQMYQELEENGYKFNKSHWEYFYHQSNDMILNTKIDPVLIEEFFALNDFGKSGRI